MSSVATLSTTIDSQIKASLLQFCKHRGLKLQYVVEQALVEQLEDEIDLDAYRQRHHEETISFEKILVDRRRKK